MFKPFRWHTVGVDKKMSWLESLADGLPVVTQSNVTYKTAHLFI
ncbi:hypothetical protein QI204_03660 [Staphylococcus saprophyticus]|nr:hypothetical protein [Staphylococcus saprophyticus]